MDLSTLMSALNALVALLIFADQSLCFTLKPFASRGPIVRLFTVNEDAKDGVSSVSADDTQSNSTASAQKMTTEFYLKGLRRTVDYPVCFNCDDIPNGKRRRQNVVVRAPSSSEKEQIYRSNSSKDGVAIPKNKNNNVPSSFRDSLSKVFEPSFDPDNDVKKKARQTRLLDGRAYALKEPFATENITAPPNLEDLRAAPRGRFEELWIKRPFQFCIFLTAYFIFPYLTKFLEYFVTMEPSQLDDITSKFAPGVSILYGTFVSLTLSILYNRQQNIQENVAIECALLVNVLRNFLSLYKRDAEKAIEAGQCIADQIRTLVRSSRGAELMLLMYSDPYARMQEIMDRYEDETPGSSVGKSASLISSSRDILKDLFKIRANRLSDEALALPPTHYGILNSLTALIMLGYSISILPTVSATGEPSNESSLLFGFLAMTYVLFYNFASDLNNPFQGVYQVRRSCATTHMLEAKWLIANHPVLSCCVDFEQVEADPRGGVLIRSPGLGDLWFEQDDIFVDPEVSEEKEETIA